MGSNGKTACNGDSGGPAFIQLEDGTWRTFGITSHGEDTSCTKVAYYTHAAIMVPWMQGIIHEQGDKDIDVTPCFDDDGTWNPSKDYETAYGDWENFCSEGAPKSGASATCGDPNPEAGDVEEKEGDSSKGKLKVRFKTPKDEARFQEGEEIDVEVDADDDDLEIELFVDGDSVSVDDAAPYAWTLEDLEPGRHELVAKAQDEDKNKGSTKTLKIVVSKRGEEDSEAPEPSNGSEKGSSESAGSSDPEASSAGTPGTSAQQDPKASGGDPKPGKSSGCSTALERPVAAYWTLLGCLGLLRFRRKRG